MIITPHFTIGHIMKTGGDAAKQICFAVFSAGLESNYTIDTIFGEHKHRPFDGTEKVRVLTFRRLPSWIMSFQEHGVVYGDYTRGTADDCANSGEPDKQLSRMIKDGELAPHRWLRMEYLRTDLHKLLSEYYGQLPERIELLLRNCPTKLSMRYPHDPILYFTEEQLHRLYGNNPLWTMYEQKVYGETL